MSAREPGSGAEADRALALRLFRVGLAAADPEAAVRRALSRDPPEARGDVLVLAAGKAAMRMLDGASDWIAGLARPPEILAVTNRENAPGTGVPAPDREAPARSAAHPTGDPRAPQPTVFLAGHPVPDAVGLRAARAFEAALGAAGARDARAPFARRRGLGAAALARARADAGGRGRDGAGAPSLGSVDLAGQPGAPAPLDAQGRRASRGWPRPRRSRR